MKSREWKNVPGGGNCVCQGQEVERGLVHSENCTYSALVWEERSEAWEDRGERE